MGKRAARQSAVPLGVVEEFPPFPGRWNPFEDERREQSYVRRAD